MFVPEVVVIEVNISNNINIIFNKQRIVEFPNKELSKLY